MQQIIWPFDIIDPGNDEDFKMWLSNKLGIVCHAISFNVHLCLELDFGPVA